jgi:iron complex outermembrane receptor protein
MSSQASGRRTRLLTQLLGGTALVAAAMAAGAASAQSANPTAVEEVVVTGTSIRGAAPVGANVISVTREDIEATGAQTVQQLLKSVPQVTGFNNTGQGGFGSADGSGTNAPTIHSLGASASNQTLVLIDGHRLPLTGLNHTLADPSVIPPIALQAVEVLPDGSSAIYGSDAVAGVLNFITRRNFTGWETSAQAGFGDGYKTANVGVVFGHAWETGSAMLAYGGSYRSALEGDSRDYYTADQRSRGGGNFASFNCFPAAVRVGGASGTIYQGTYTGSGQPGNTPAFCDTTRVADMIPQEIRNSILAKIEQQVSDALTLNADIVFSERVNKAVSSRGNLTNVTVFGPGAANASQINPFFQGPAGATSEIASLNFDSLLGPGAQTKSGQKTAFITLGAEYKLPGDWQATLGGTFGGDDSYSNATGTVCAPCALLAMNGTVNAGGSLTANANPPVNGTVTNVTRALNTTNALDIWNAGSANRTSADVLRQLTDSINYSDSKQTIKTGRIKLDGPLFTLPAGQVKAAVGAEAIAYDLRQITTRTGAAGPASVSTASSNLVYNRSVYAFFGEVLIPLIGPDNALPFVRRLDISLAGRYDHYDDFGETTNPKYAFTWKPIDDLQLRGSWGTSFTAAALTSRGGPNGLTGESSVTTSGQINVPSTFPGVGTICPTTAGCAIGGSTAIQGLQVNGGDDKLKAQTGESHSFGFDYNPSWANGLSVSVTYWNTDINGAITAPNSAQAVISPGLYSRLTLNPTAAQIAAATAGLPQNGALPANIRFIYSFRQGNVFNLNADGLDYDVRYRFTTDGLGDFRLGFSASQKLHFDQQIGDGAVVFDRLNTAGVNTTFSSLEWTGRLTAAWDMGPWSADVSYNYTNPYLNLNGNAPFPVTTSGATVTGGQSVDAFQTVDLHVGYKFETEGMLADTSVFADVSNLFDEDPPFSNQSGGYNGSDASPIGRVITLGISKKW